MTVLGSAYFSGHMFVVEMSSMNKVKVLYDGKEVYSKYHINGLGTYVFNVTEDGQDVFYEAEIGFGRRKLKFRLRRNGFLVFSNEDGFIPPKPELVHPQNHLQKKEIMREVVVKEVVLVVCPSCNHRNDSSRRNCENCGASI